MINILVQKFLALTLVATVSALVATLSAGDSSASPAAVAKHVLTADYLRGPNKDTALPPSKIAPWLSWATTSWQLNPAARAAGIKAMYYTNPNRQNPTNPMYGNDESTFAHACDGSRIASKAYQGQYLMDLSSPSMRALWKKHIASRSSSRVWDAFFVDDANTVYGLTGLPCNYSPNSWLETTRKAIEEMGVPIIYNGLQDDNTRELNKAHNVLGGMEEGCYASALSRPKIWDSYWVQLENTEIAMAQDGKLFFCFGRDSSDTNAAIDGRLYTYASFLLTYSLRSSVLWEAYNTPSRFRVGPESTLVALEPTTPTPSDVSGLRLSTGVYGREYRRCYIWGSPVGACAVVVNPDRSAMHGYPFGNRYQHSIVLSGSGVMDGGSISASGPPPPDTLPPLGANIVFQ